jgi:hypothetical protein
MTLQEFLSGVAAVLTAFAAIVALRAATVTVRDNIDAFIGDLQKQGRWAAWAAVLNALTAAILVYQTFAGRI